MDEHQDPTDHPYPALCLSCQASVPPPTPCLVCGTPTIHDPCNTCWAAAEYVRRSPRGALLVLLGAIFRRQVEEGWLDPLADTQRIVIQTSLGHMPPAKVAAALGLGRATVYRWIASWAEGPKE